MAGYNPPYLPHEQEAIVQYIIKRNAFTQIKGDRLWKDMEKANIVHRSWQSLKQHFRKTIIKQLHYPRYGLDAETIKGFMDNFNKIDKRRKKTSRKRTAQSARRRQFGDVTAWFSTSDSDSDDEIETDRGDQETLRSLPNSEDRPSTSKIEADMSTEDDDTPDLNIMSSDDDSVVHVQTVSVGETEQISQGQEALSGQDESTSRKCQLPNSEDSTLRKGAEPSSPMEDDETPDLNVFTPEEESVVFVEPSPHSVIILDSSPESNM